jgi:hypothetical protein
MGKAKLTEMEYTTIKQLLEKGHEGQKVAAIVGRGRGVVSLVNTTSSYKEYVERGKAARAKYKTSTKRPKAQQLPLDTPKKTEYGLIQGMTDKIAALRDDIELYRASPACSGRERQRDAAYALIKLEEAAMWLTRHW